MQRRATGNIRTEIAVVANPDLCIILYGKVEVHEAMIANFSMTTVMKTNGAKHYCSFPDIFQELL